MRNSLIALLEVLFARRFVSRPGPDDLFVALHRVTAACRVSKLAYGGDES